MLRVGTKVEERMVAMQDGIPILETLDRKAAFEPQDSLIEVERT